MKLLLHSALEGSMLTEINMDVTRILASTIKATFLTALQFSVSELPYDCSSINQLRYVMIMTLLE